MRVCGGIVSPSSRGSVSGGGWAVESHWARPLLLPLSVKDSRAQVGSHMTANRQGSPRTPNPHPCSPLMAG